MHRSPGRVADGVRSFPTSRKAVMCSDRRSVSPHCGFSHPVCPEMVDVPEEQGSETLLTSVAKTRALSRMSLAKAWRVRDASHCLMRHREYRSRNGNKHQEQELASEIRFVVWRRKLVYTRSRHWWKVNALLTRCVVHRLPNAYSSSTCKSTGIYIHLGIHILFEWTECLALGKLSVKYRYASE